LKYFKLGLLAVLLKMFLSSHRFFKNNLKQKYIMGKRVSSINGAGKSGQLHTKE